MSLEILQKFIPNGSPVKPTAPMCPTFITIHTTANYEPSADALGHGSWLTNPTNKGEVSWHFTVDDKRAVQHLRTDEQGWHAGDGRGLGNTASIGIEICENAGADFEKAVANAIELVVMLMKSYNIPMENVVPHKRWSGKECPRLLLARWPEITQRLRAACTPSVAGVAVYVVQNGDNLSTIAYNAGITLDDLIRVNPQIKNPAFINVGDRINLPGKSAPAPSDPLAGVPDWAREAVKCAMAKNVIDTPTGTDDFYRFVTILHRLGLFK